MYSYPWGREDDETDYSDPRFNPSLGESLECYSDDQAEVERRRKRLSTFQSLIDRGGGVMAIGGHLMLLVSDEPPPNKSHVVYAPLRTATAELLLDAADNAARPELIGIKQIPRSQWGANPPPPGPVHTKKES